MPTAADSSSINKCDVHLQAGITSHPLFVAILAGEAVLQALIVQTGGPAFHTTPLSADQWTLCVGLGALTLGVRASLRHVKLTSDT
jgi:hypothetical protein